MQKLRRLGRARGVEVLLIAQRGKGSHATLFYGAQRTIIPDLKKELPVGTLHSMLAQFGLTVRDLQEGKR